ncbi:hypothetical protein [Streptomyces sp. NRRL S-37]|uniref:hypothetical protein n=1 Tax=Streptomyces sp. NRRL S-37 TaxID=1463903 RepID=UPI0004C8C2E1|nr:hypothetical protein [Streptomyces sp. NRRL S-37]
MHHNDPFAARVCPHCDGFAIVVIDRGSRDRYGQRVTVPVICPACWGWGVYPRMPRRRFNAPAGR